MPPGFAEFLEIVGRYGFWNAVFGISILLAILAWYRGGVAKNHVATSDADSFKTLANAITQLVTANNQEALRAGQERMQTLLHIEKMTGRIEGMMSAILANTDMARATKIAVDGLGVQLDEFGARMRPIENLPKIQTDLQELVAQSLSFTNALDQRFVPVAKAITDLSKEVRDLALAAAPHNERVLRNLETILGLLNMVKDQITADVLSDQIARMRDPATKGPIPIDTAQVIPMSDLPQEPTP